MGAWDVKSALDRAAQFAGGVARRFMADDCLRAASALSYTSILALVPLVAVLVTLAGVFPAASAMMERVEAFAFEHFLPDLGEQTVAQVKGFIGNAGQLGVLSALFLVVTAALTLSTIEHALNEIWRVAQPRPPLQKVITYWTMVTLGPLLFGASLSLSGYAFALGQRVGIDPARLPVGSITVMLPWLLELVGFTLMYTVIPNRMVRFRHGLIGGLVATFAFEVLKKGFGIYVAGAVDYRTLYGALAAVPLFLVWMYLSWATALLGAEVAAFLPEWNAHRRGLGGALGAPRRRLHLAVALLAELAMQARTGSSLTRKRLREVLPAAFTELEEVLDGLEQHRFIARRNERWWLARDLSRATLGDLMQALGIGLPTEFATDTAPDAPPAARRLDQRLRRLLDAERAGAAITLAELLAEERTVMPLAGAERR